MTKRLHLAGTVGVDKAIENNKSKLSITYFRNLSIIDILSIDARNDCT